MRRYTLFDHAPKTGSTVNSMPPWAFVTLREAEIRRRFTLVLPETMLDERHLLFSWARHCRQNIESARISHASRGSWPSRNALEEIIKMLEKSTADLWDIMSIHKIKLGESVIHDLLLFNGSLELFVHLASHDIADMDTALRTHIEEPLDAIIANSRVRVTPSLPHPSPQW